MKKQPLFSIQSLVLIGLASSFAVAMPPLQIPPNYQDIVFEPYQFVAPSPKNYRVEAVPGQVIYFVPNKALPLLKINFQFLEKNVSTSPDTLLAYSLLGQMLKTGGSKKLKPAAIEDSLEFMSAQWGVSAGANSTNISLDVMAKDLDATLALIHQICTQPRFDKDRFELLKKNLVQSLEHRYDAAPAVSADLYDKVLYGDHIQFKPTSINLVKNLDPEIFQKIVTRLFSQDKMIISVTGQYDQKNLTVKLQRWLAQFPKHKASSFPAKWVEPVVVAKPGIWLIDRPSTQAQIKMGVPFVKRPHPDYFAASVAAYILGGGGFTSRLVTRVRTEEGLAYHIGAGVANNYFLQGAATINTQTKVESTARTLQLIQEELKKFAQEGPTALELKNAQDGIVSSLPEMFDTPSSTVGAFAQNEFNGRSLDYFSQYPDSIRALTIEQVRAAAQKYFDFSKMSITIVGPKDIMLLPDAKFKTKLEDFGTLNWLKLEDLRGE
jgi:zinc protease